MTISNISNISILVVYHELTSLIFLIPNETVIATSYCRKVSAGVQCYCFCIPEYTRHSV